MSEFGCARSVVEPFSTIRGDLGAGHLEVPNLLRLVLVALWTQHPKQTQANPGNPLHALTKETPEERRLRMLVSRQASVAKARAKRLSIGQKGFNLSDLKKLEEAACWAANHKKGSKPPSVLAGKLLDFAEKNYAAFFRNVLLPMLPPEKVVPDPTEREVLGDSLEVCRQLMKEIGYGEDDVQRGAEGSGGDGDGVGASVAVGVGGAVGDNGVHGVESQSKLTKAQRQVREVVTSAALPPPVVAPALTPPAPAAPYLPEPTLCWLCKPQGYTRCPECCLANDPGLQEGPTGTLFWNKVSTPYDPSRPWHRHLGR